MCVRVFSHFLSWTRVHASTSIQPPRLFPALLFWTSCAFTHVCVYLLTHENLEIHADSLSSSSSSFLFYYTHSILYFNVLVPIRINRMPSVRIHSPHSFNLFLLAQKPNELLRKSPRPHMLFLLRNAKSSFLVSFVAFANIVCAALQEPPVSRAGEREEIAY